ncbi:ribosome modulation factor [Roseibium sp. SCP14]|uniref:ribosome modulation factor n=1 Tax=Roseibium sp. SCP14 TaxID=3141375 RepID=UPI0033397D3D
MTTYQTKAQTHAFERGMEAYREGKSQTENPYPREADYFDFWEQGYLTERDANRK